MAPKTAPLQFAACANVAVETLGGHVLLCFFISVLFVGLIEVVKLLEAFFEYFMQQFARFRKERFIFLIVSWHLR